MTFHTGLSRDGPGLMVRDLMADAADTDLRQLVAIAPDIVVLQNVDFDYDGIAVRLIRQRLADLGHEMPHIFVTRPNTGIDSEFDLDQNGKLGEPRDMLGYGRFSGQGGMLLLSRFPLVAGQAKNLSHMLWRDQDAPGLPVDGYYSDDVLAVLPLHSVAAWDVTIETPSRPLRILTSHASTPAFDGPEERTGLRNAADRRFWRRYVERLDDQEAVFVLLGTLNNDPGNGEGHKPDIDNLLKSPAVQDPFADQPGTLISAEWTSGLALRGDYVLPSHRLGVRAAKIERAPRTATGSLHYPVWVDIFWQ